MTQLDIRAIQEAELPKKRRPPIRQGFRIFISEAAFDAATSRGLADTSREVGGILVGQLCRDDEGPFVRVDATIDALHAEEKGTELTFTHATWEHIHSEMDGQHKGKQIVGWYHTHPGFGIFLSDRDCFIHQSFFNLPHQLALVFDPKSREHGVFSWRNGKPVRCRQYWVGEREHTWEGSREEPSRDVAQAEVHEMPTGKTDPEPYERMDLITLGLGGLLILVIGISLGWWLGRDKPSSVLQSRDAKLQTQLLIAQESVRAFSLEMVGTMRELVGGETIQRPLRQSLAELDAGLAALKKEEGEAGQRFQEARRLINNLATEHQRGQLALTRMEQTIRRAADKAHGVQISLAKQNAAIGMLYIELASEIEKQGNLKRAQELLMTAARVDPNNASLYMDKRRRLGGEEKESTP